MTRLAIVVSHPIQYYAPWFRLLAETSGLAVKVFYLWDFGVTGQCDHGFGVSVRWDVPLLGGYEHEFVPNVARDPGTHHFNGLDNPDLGRRLAEFAPDVILLFGYAYWTHQRLVWLDRPKGIPLLFRGDSHDLAPDRSLKQAIKRLALTRMFARFDAFLAVGRANADYFRHGGVRDERIVFVPHCVDNERFRRDGTPAEGAAVREELGIPPDHQVVLFAGKFEPKKRPDDLVSAFLAAGRSDATLVLAGAGELEPLLRRRAAGCSHVRFLPFQNQSAMPRLYAAADLFVLPSVGRYETWGLAVNEAMCCGCAVIVSNHVGCGPDLVRDGENGRIVQAGNVGALEEAVEDALSDRERLARWQYESRQIVAAYTFDAARDGLIEALDVVFARQQEKKGTTCESSF